MTASTQRPSREVTVPIVRTDADLDRALEAIRALMDKGTLTTAEEARLDTTAVLVEVYERAHFPIGPPEPIAAIKFRLEQLGFVTNAQRTKALVPILGTRARVHEVMNRVRALSPRMVNGLWKTFDIPLEVLVSGMLVERRPARKVARPGTRPLRAPARRAAYTGP